MRRILLTVAIAVGLAIGAMLPVAAIGETQVTLNCSDGTSVSLVVDADTLTGLTESIQAMIDYPAGLSCTLVQVPLGLGAVFGRIALASPGQSPFIVAGGRWLVPCSLFPPPGGGGGSVDGGTVAKLPGSWSSLLSLGWVPVDDTDQVWVNISVNVHQAGDETFFGTLNETIPENQFCPDLSTGTTFAVGPSHFVSRPTCFAIGPDPSRAFVTSSVVQTSGLPFPSGSAGSLGFESAVHFSFQDNGNPSSGVKDKLQGPPAGNDSICPTEPGSAPDFDLIHGNITLHPKP
ncbi:MAG TPA: hypothetical protein VGR87_09350 [Candidatus Limnocylindria bacterium]|jgi:hypothetical protein|nr:hypothetical protein [Candidatus Limnocylindria bacterium]